MILAAELLLDLQRNLGKLPLRRLRPALDPFEDDRQFFRFHDDFLSQSARIGTSQPR